MDLEARKRIVERHVTKARWDSSGEFGYCACPGDWLHTTKNGPKDAKILLTGNTVTITCFHTSCEEQLKYCNRLIRSELAGLPGEQTKQQKREQNQEFREIFHTAQTILNQLDKIYRRFWWGPELLARQLNAEESIQRFLELYNDDDVTWIGEVHHSGPMYGYGHFRLVADWKQAPRYWAYTCTGIFNSVENVYRGKQQVVRQDYNCLEFDKLDPDPEQNQLKSIALYFYLEESFGLRGKVAINTGNKSIHFWVRNDPAVFDDSFRLFLKQLGADPAGFRPYQPVRFPGVLRPETKKLQTLMAL